MNTRKPQHQHIALHHKAQEPYPELLLDNQLCFLLYATSKAATRRYAPLLDKLGLTYTQYLTMLVLWERDGQSVRELGERLHLDSGTLTPVLKKLEQAGFLERTIDSRDERHRSIVLTAAGQKLREKARDIPHCMAAELSLNEKETRALMQTLNHLLSDLSAAKE
ncbi:MarR family transcriptional regulator [Collinsella sp. zg1085]|uniref:MarR family winged helix-turn-helix transcriptional regulator n=1 Tax=Collinsella sp. zg1085 TaxID=2844380 RepID=UPI001C0C4732|nr:MarR family transcriptional regulator [Collinsella sp. zg1085]QWT17490.1 MarR family transcriptional regulator [Collinsella sp. zg1085]